jgi:hypothetical protein
VSKETPFVDENENNYIESLTPTDLIMLSFMNQAIPEFKE